MCTIIHIIIKKKNDAETDLGGNQGEIAGIGGSGSFAPIDKANCVLRVSGHAEGVDETRGKHWLLEAITASFSVQWGEDEAQSAEVIGGVAVGVEELAKLGAFFERRFSFLYPVEETHQNAHFCLLGLAHFEARRGRWRRGSVLPFSQYQFISMVCFGGIPLSPRRRRVLQAQNQ